MLLAENVELVMRAVIDSTLQRTTRSSNRALRARLAGFLLIAALGLPQMQVAPACAPNPLGVHVQATASYKNLPEALFDIGSRFHVCIALELRDGRPMTTPVRFARRSGPAGIVVRDLLRRNLLGYCVSGRGRILAVTPCSPVGDSWLDYRIVRIDRDKDFLQETLYRLYLSLRGQLQPGKGLAGSWIGAPSPSLIGPYHLHDESIRHLLERFVGDSQGALWMTVRPYLRERGFEESPPEQFWAIVEYGDAPAMAAGALRVWATKTAEAFAARE